MTSRRLPATIIALGFVSLLTDASSEMIAALLPVFIIDVLGRGAAMVGVVEGAADAVASLVKLASGAVADRVPRRMPLVVAGYTLSSLTRPLMGFAALPWHVFAVRVTDRIGKGIRSAPRDAVLADASPPGRAGEAFGFHRAMDHAGAIIGPLLAAGLLAVGLSLRGVFLMASVPAALALLALTAVREAPRENIVVEAVAPGSAPMAWRSPMAAWRSLPPAARTFLGVLLLFGLGHATDAFLLVRARDLGVATAALPILWACFHVAKVLSSLGGGALSDHVGRKRLIVSGWIVHATALVGFGLATRAWQAWLIFILYGLYHGLTEPAEKALVRDLVPAEMRGRAYGFYNFVVGITALPAGLLIGLAWQHFGALPALCASSALSLICAVMLAAFMPREVALT